MHWMTPTFEFSFGKLLDCTMLGTAPCLLRGLLYCALCLVSETWFLPANISHKLSAQMVASWTLGPCLQHALMCERDGLQAHPTG